MSRADPATQTPDEAPERRTPSLLFKLIFCLLFSLVSGELVCRFALASRLAFTHDERSLAYRHHPRYGWFPKPGQSGKMVSSRPFSYTHNQRGFRDDPWPKTKQGTRIAVFGDSFVWGYDADKGERLTDIMRSRLTDAQILNLGVSGYGTDQALLLAEDLWDQAKPDIVILVVCYNDSHDNNSNRRYGYQKPWFELSRGQLSLHGPPVPRSWRYLVAESPRLYSSYLARAIAKLAIAATRPARVERNSWSISFAIIDRFAALVKSKGAQFLVAYQGSEAPFAKHLEGKKIPWLKLSDLPTYPTWGGHWTPDGNRRAAQRILKRLLSDGLLTPKQIRPMRKP